MNIVTIGSVLWKLAGFGKASTVTDQAKKTEGTIKSIKEMEQYAKKVDLQVTKRTQLNSLQDGQAEEIERTISTRERQRMATSAEVSKESQTANVDLIRKFRV